MQIQVSILLQCLLSHSGWHMTSIRGPVLYSRSLLVIHFKCSSVRHCLGFRHKQGEALGDYPPKVLRVLSDLNHCSKNVK